MLGVISSIRVITSHRFRLMFQAQARLHFLTVGGWHSVGLAWHGPAPGTSSLRPSVCSSPSSSLGGAPGDGPPLSLRRRSLRPMNLKTSHRHIRRNLPHLRMLPQRAPRPRRSRTELARRARQSRPKTVPRRARAAHKTAPRPVPRPGWPHTLPHDDGGM